MKKVRKKEAIPGKPLEKANKKDEIKTVQQKPTPKVEPETKPVVKADKKDEVKPVAKAEVKKQKTVARPEVQIVKVLESII